MCGQVVYLLSQQGYSNEQIDRMVPFGCLRKGELPADLVKYWDYIIRKTMERYERICK